MNAIELETLELMEGWSEEDPTMRNRFAFPVSAQTGAAAAAVVYFEVEPGRNCGRHVHSTEEVMVIVAGTAEVEIDGDRRTVRAPGLAHVPAWVPHNVHATGTSTLRVASVFASAVFLTRFEETVAPLGTKEVVVGAPVPVAQPA
jgi:quercetin dioxygenase-like cupin family protein